MTGEASPAYLIIGWTALLGGMLLDHVPERQSELSRFDTVAVAGLVINFIVDVRLWQSTLFVAIAHFLLLFQAYKCIGYKGRKDVFQMLLFAFFQVLAACTLSLEMWHALIFAALIPCATAALFWQQVDQHAETFRRPGDEIMGRPYRRLAAAMAAIALPVNIVLTAIVFLLFPRLTFNVTLPGMGNQRMGYTEQVNLAKTGQLENNTAVILWLEIPEKDRSLWSGYLRGTTMERFDGTRWSAMPVHGARMLVRDGNGVFRVQHPIPGLPVIHMSVTLLNTAATTLFTSGVPYSVVAPLGDLRCDGNMSLHWTSRWDRPLRYDVLAGVDPNTDVPESLMTSEAALPYLQLPSTPMEKIEARAREASGRGTSLELATNIAEYLSKNYSYSLDLGSDVSPNPVERFLEETKRGPCGHFASAMALMLRLRGIPSRVVAGYYRGEYNSVAHQYLFRERDAHAWVEAYIADRGWVRFDPSPRQPPAVTSVQRWSLGVRQYWDYLGFQWDRLVIDYDLYAQLRAIERLRSSSDNVNQSLASWWSRHFQRSKRGGAEQTDAADPVHWRDWVTGKSVGVLLSLALLAVIWVFWSPRAISPSQASIQNYRRFLARMQRAGIPKAENETGWEFARRLSTLRPELRSDAEAATGRYYSKRFGTPSAT